MEIDLEYFKNDIVLFYDDSFRKTLNWLIQYCSTPIIKEFLEMFFQTSDVNYRILKLDKDYIEGDINRYIRKQTELCEHDSLKDKCKICGVENKCKFQLEHSKCMDCGTGTKCRVRINHEEHCIDCGNYCLRFIYENHRNVPKNVLHTILHQCILEYILQNKTKYRLIYKSKNPIYDEFSKEFNGECFLLKYPIKFRSEWGIYSLCGETVLLNLFNYILIKNDKNEFDLKLIKNDNLKKFYGKFSSLSEQNRYTDVLFNEFISIIYNSKYSSKNCSDLFHSSSCFSRNDFIPTTKNVICVLFIFFNNVNVNHDLIQNIKYINDGIKIFKSSGSSSDTEVYIIDDEYKLTLSEKHGEINKIYKTEKLGVKDELIRKFKKHDIIKIRKEHILRISCSENCVKENCELCKKHNEYIRKINTNTFILGEIIQNETHDFLTIAFKLNKYNVTMFCHGVKNNFIPLSDVETIIHKSYFETLYFEIFYMIDNGKDYIEQYNYYTIELINKLRLTDNLYSYNHDILYEEINVIINTDFLDLSLEKPLTPPTEIIHSDEEKIKARHFIYHEFLLKNKFKKLKHLNLSNSKYLEIKIPSFQTFLTTLTSLEYINLSNLDINITVSFLETFISLTNLKFLNLSGNKQDGLNKNYCITGFIKEGDFIFKKKSLSPIIDELVESFVDELFSSYEYEYSLKTFGFKPHIYDEIEKNIKTKDEVMYRSCLTSIFLCYGYLNKYFERSDKNFRIFVTGGIILEKELGIKTGDVDVKIVPINEKKSVSNEDINFIFEYITQVVIRLNSNIESLIDFRKSYYFSTEFLQKQISEIESSNVDPEDKKIEDEIIKKIHSIAVYEKENIIDMFLSGDLKNNYTYLLKLLDIPVGNLVKEKTVKRLLIKLDELYNFNDYCFEIQKTRYQLYKILISNKKTPLKKQPISDIYIVNKKKDGEYFWLKELYIRDCKRKYFEEIKNEHFILNFFTLDYVKYEIDTLIKNPSFIGQKKEDTINYYLEKFKSKQKEILETEEKKKIEGTTDRGKRRMKQRISKKKKSKSKQRKISKKKKSKSKRRRISKKSKRRSKQRRIFKKEF